MPVFCWQRSGRTPLSAMNYFCQLCQLANFALRLFCKPVTVLSTMSEVIIPYHHPNPPEPHEIEVARLLAEHYNCTVEFLIPINDYKRKTPDIRMFGRFWEIKSPVGNSRRRTVQRQFDYATKQRTHSLILDCRRTKLDDDFVIKDALRELKLRTRIKEVIIIAKTGKIIELP